MSLMIVLLKYHGQSSPRSERIAAHLQSANGGWWNQSEGCWFIADTHRSSMWWSETIRGMMSEQDSVLVSTVHLSDLRGWAPRNVWDWFQANGVTPKTR